MTLLNTEKMNVYKLFQYLKQTQGRPIPLIVRAVHEPNTLTPEEWAGFEDYDVMTILSRQPKVIDKFPKHFVDELHNEYVAEILSKQPTLINRFDVSHLQEREVCTILTKQPGLLNKFNISKLESYARALIISQQPQLIDKIDTSNLNNYSVFYLLNQQPQLIDKIDISKLKAHDKMYPSVSTEKLLKRHPQLKPYFDDDERI